MKNETLRMQDHINTLPGIRGVSFTVKLKSNGDVRAVIMSLETSTDTENGGV